jgi:hypothetical protein
VTPSFSPSADTALSSKAGLVGLTPHLPERRLPDFLLTTTDRLAATTDLSSSTLAMCSTIASADATFSGFSTD